MPLTEHHTLIILKRLVMDCFGLTQTEINAFHQLIPRRKGGVENPKDEVRHATPWKGNYGVDQ